MIRRWIGWLFWPQDDTPEVLLRRKDDHAVLAIRYPRFTAEGLPGCLLTAGECEQLAAAFGIAAERLREKGDGCLT